MDNAQILYRSTNPNIVQPISIGRRKFPLSKDNFNRTKGYALDVEFSCLLDVIGNNAGGSAILFPSLQFNTPASNAGFNMPAGSTMADANAILTDYSQPSDIGSGLGRFTATFNLVPASWDDFVTQQWTPPGWIGPTAGAAGSTYTARDAYPRETTVRIHYDYFVVDTNNVLPGGILDSGGNAIVASSSGDSLLTGNTAAKKVSGTSAIPCLYKTYFCNTLINSGTPPTPVYSSHVNSLSPSGGLIGGGEQGYVETFPSIQAYMVWVANVQALIAAGNSPWTGLVWDGGFKQGIGYIGSAPFLDQAQGSITQIILKDSQIKQYAGNIFSRVTTYAIIV